MSRYGRGLAWGGWTFSYEEAGIYFEFITADESAKPYSPPPGSEVTILLRNAEMIASLPVAARERLLRVITEVVSELHIIPQLKDVHITKVVFTDRTKQGLSLPDL